MIILFLKMGGCNQCMGEKQEENLIILDHKPLKEV